LLPISPTWRPVSLPTCWTPPHVSSGFRPRGFSPPRRLTPAPASGVLQPNRTRFAAFQHNLTPTRDPDTRCRSSGCPGPLSWPTAVRSQQRYTPRRIPLAGSGTASLRPLPSCRSISTCSGLHIPKMRRREPSLPAVRRPSGTRPSTACRASLSTGRSSPGRGQLRHARFADGGWTDHQDSFSSSRRTRARPRTLSRTRIPTAEAAGPEPPTLSDEPKLPAIAACPVTSRLAFRTRRSALRRCPRPLGPPPTPKRRPRSRS
jgi:hypothetical protein